MEEQKNPWKINSSKQVYDNPWISVTEYDVINPSGGKGIYGKVHFKNIAIAILPLDEHLNTYLVGQYRFPTDSYSWEIPEGGGHPGIDPLESAQRELLEETGLVARKWTVLNRVHLSNSVSDEAGVVFLAQDLEQSTPQPEETEQLIIKKISLEEVWKMIERGEITDSLTIIAIQKLKLLLAEGKIN